MHTELNCSRRSGFLNVRRRRHHILHAYDLPCASCTTSSAHSAGTTAYRILVLHLERVDPTLADVGLLVTNESGDIQFATW